ncbi:hypothetical protein FOMG_15380 [Fusarium oxysporum f. sp. melonis 26406]|uniref:Uncharacterized protein n=1 Tax=Fusarium oxysporum f. sp. melonis 26406 TaxID=1089452 RepID=X0A591_FUSOX|nr:hypothetical protein FOMG_15380 [Fusarium oxysporum f. sp. melonis 26406]
MTMHLTVAIMQPCMKLVIGSLMRFVRSCRL